MVSKLPKRYYRGKDSYEISKKSSWNTWLDELRFYRICILRQNQRRVEGEKMQIKMENNIPDDTVIWRYIDLSKLLDLLITEELHFTRADKLKDPFDSSITELYRHYLIKVNGGAKPPDFDKGMDQLKTAEESGRKKIYLNC
jgi:hypothetical protein